MGTFIRAVVTGFGFSLGSALFKKVSERIGLNEESKGDKAPEAREAAGEGEGGEESGEDGGEGDGGGGKGDGDGGDQVEPAPISS
jgi:hypothetical protein